MSYLNYSRAKTFWDCHRRWALQFLFGWKPKHEDEVLSMGTAVHAGMAVLSSGGEIATAAQQAAVTYLQLRSAHWDGIMLAEWQGDAAYAARMVELYATTGPSSDYTVKGVEQVSSARIGEVCHVCGDRYPEEESNTCISCGSPAHYWVGVIDVDVEHHGEPGILDHKTTSSTPSDEWLDSWSRSFQLVGYAYIRSKETGLEYRQVGVNALQKAATLGKPEAVSKACPDCRNGVKKKVNCITCGGAGRVEKVVPLDPFRRKWFHLLPAAFDRFELYALQTIRAIDKEIALFKANPLDAFPMNDQACRRCPMKEFCWGDTPPTRWFEFSEPPDGFIQKRDYVDAMSVAAEEVI